MPERESGRGRGRGQSEALGFVLVFAIIITSVVLVTATGYGGLQQIQSAERTNNAVNAFEVLAGNVDGLAQGAPSRETELTLAGAGLSFGDPVTINVSYSNATYTSPVVTTESRPLVYDPGTGSTLVYENGAVIRVDRDGLVMLREPRLRLTSSEAVIPVIEVRSPETRSVGGQSTVSVRTRRNESVPLLVTTAKYDLTLTIDSPRADAWSRHLSSHAGVTCNPPPTGGTVTCTLTTDRAYATLVRVDATFN